MMSLTTAIDYARGMLDSGKVADAAEANVEIVRMMGVRIIDSPIPGAVRKALNAAVKEGRLGHVAKKGLFPEAYFNGNDNARWNALELREQMGNKKVEAIRKVCCTEWVTFPTPPGPPRADTLGADDMSENRKYYKIANEIVHRHCSAGHWREAADEIVDAIRKAINEVCEPVLIEAMQKEDIFHDTWNTDAHIEMTLTIAEIRAMHNSMSVNVTELKHG